MRVVLAVGIVVHLLCPLPPSHCLSVCSSVRLPVYFGRVECTSQIRFPSAICAVQFDMVQRCMQQRVAESTPSALQQHQLQQQQQQLRNSNSHDSPDLTRSQCRASRSCSQKLAMQQTCAFSSVLCPALTHSLSLSPCLLLSLSVCLTLMLVGILQFTKI